MKNNQKQIHLEPAPSLSGPVTDSLGVESLNPHTNAHLIHKCQVNYDNLTTEIFVVVGSIPDNGFGAAVAYKRINLNARTSDNHAGQNPHHRH